MIYSMQKINVENTVGSLLNCGLGDEYTIKEIAETIKEVVGFKGEIEFDSTRPEGVKRRAMNSEKFNKLIHFGDRTSLEKGLKETYEYFLR